MARGCTYAHNVEAILLERICEELAPVMMCTTITSGHLMLEIEKRRLAINNIQVS